MILLTHQRPSQGDAALPARWIEHTLDRECCNVTADAAGGIGAPLRCVRRRKFAARKRENAVRHRSLRLVTPLVARALYC